MQVQSLVMVCDCPKKILDTKSEIEKLFSFKLFSKFVGREKLFVRCVHLFQDDERDHSVWSQSSIVRSETFPQTENTFIANHFGQNILNVQWEEIELESRKR